MIDTAAPLLSASGLPLHAWQLRAQEVELRLLACPLRAPMLEATPLGPGAFRVFADCFELVAHYRPSWSGAAAKAVIHERDWRVPRVLGEDHAAYLAARLAAELRAGWDRRAEPGSALFPSAPMIR